MTHHLDPDRELDDLGTLERVAERAQTRDDWAAVPPHKVLALVAELRAARKVIEAARRYEGGTAAYQNTVWSTIVTYDETVET